MVARIKKFRKLIPTTKWASEFNTALTVPFFHWLVGPSEGVKSLHVEDMDVVVEPGIGWMELNEYLEPYGLFSPLDPGCRSEQVEQLGSSFACSGSSHGSFIWYHIVDIIFYCW